MNSDKDESLTITLYIICQGVFYIEKHSGADYGMSFADMLLLSFREAAAVSVEMNQKQVIVVDCGHGGMDPV
ncbi:MAG: hypothetical protein ACLRMZ_24485 [Blautia marasmi]